MPRLPHLIVVLWILACVAPVRADAPRLRTLFPVDPPEGVIVVTGSDGPPTGAAREGLLAQTPCRVTVITDGEETTAHTVSWSGPGVEAVDVLRIEDAQWLHPERAANTLKQATVVWLDLTRARSADRRGVPDNLASALREVLARRGAVGMGAGAMTLVGDVVPGSTVGGLSLLPGFAVSSSEDAIEQVVARHPDHVGLVVGRTGALFVRARVATVVRAPITVLHSDGGERPITRRRLRRAAPLDLVTLSRTAVAANVVAADPERDPARAARPEVAGSGTLFIGGGGRMPGGAMRRFVEASGGPDALIVVVPAAIGEDPRAGRFDVANLRRVGARNVKILSGRTPDQANEPEALDALRTAGGVWFSGGRQWRIVDAYLDTEAHRLMQAVVARGGAVGGSSAGASIQAQYMVRGHPLGNRVMMAAGYEHGLDLLPGVAIDQHFAQRGRFADMHRLKRRHPQLVGIGLDEGTLIVVQGSVLEVLGSHEAHIFDRDEPEAHVSLKAGERYDLVTRTRVE